MRPKFLYTLLCLYCLFPLSAKELYFRHIDLNDGFAQPSAISIFRIKKELSGSGMITLMCMTEESSVRSVCLLIWMGWRIIISMKSVATGIPVFICWRTGTW